jgi:hypothetical protein
MRKTPLVSREASIIRKHNGILPDSLLLSLEIPSSKVIPGNVSVGLRHLGS